MIARFVAMGSGEKRSDVVRGASSAGRLTVRSGVGSIKLGLGRDAVSSVASSAGGWGDVDSGASGGAGSPISAGSCAACAGIGGGAGEDSGAGSCFCLGCGTDGGPDSGTGTGCGGAGLGSSVSSCAGPLSRPGSIHVPAGGLDWRRGAEAISGGGCCLGMGLGLSVFGNSVALVLFDCASCSALEGGLVFGVFATGGGVPWTSASCGSPGTMAHPRTTHANEQSTSVATNLRGSIGCDPYWLNWT